jgi:hypothetical protein
LVLAGLPTTKIRAVRLATALIAFPCAEKMQTTEKELQEERDAIRNLLP